MKSPSILSLLVSAVLTAVEATTFSPGAELNALTENANANLMEILEARVGTGSNCTSENVVVRKTWGALSDEDKCNYITAMQCLMTKDPITPLSVVPGVRSRFDDFAATHVNSTASIHWTTYFFGFHRYYTWLFEQALRDECGYTGYQPYWDWSLTDNMAENPLFDGSDLSLGGDGAFIEDFVSYIIIPTPIPINITGPTGTGGGCVTSGPFANMSINLGPHGAPISDGFSYNPRCLTRNFRNFFLQDFMSYEIITAVLQEPTLQAMQDVFEGTTGLHSGGHTGQGGLQDDLWGSAQDPSFHFHHAAVDRIWSIWQAQNQTVRTQEVASTLTIHDLPPSANGTLDTPIDLYYSGGVYTIGELSSTIDGLFCYIYA